MEILLEIIPIFMLAIGQLGQILIINHMQKRIEYLEEFPKMLLDVLKKDEKEEHRCSTCAFKELCPAFETGVAFPCTHYKPEEKTK